MSTEREASLHDALEEIEVVVREARAFAWMLKDGPQKGNLAPALSYIENLADRLESLADVLSAPGTGASQGA